jgi:transposase
MLAAMIAGEDDPVRLAALARGRMRRKIPELEQALTGHFDTHHAQLARSILRRLELVEQALAELDQLLVRRAGPGRARSSCCKLFPASGRRSRK